MKKIMYAAMAALAITSCSQNEEFEAPSQKVEIGFNSFVGKATRATPMLDENFTGFKVYAYNTGTTAMVGVTVLGTTPFMAGKDVTKSGETWTTAGGPYYWPLEDNIQFFAYSPETSTAVSSYAATAKYPTFEYTINDVTSQEDLLAASATDKNKGNAIDGVSLGFKHLLTQINFSARGSTANYTYTVSEIQIIGANSKSTFTFDGSETVGSWATATTPASYVYVSDSKIVSGTGVTDFGTEANALMLMPQTLPADAKIEVSYTVNNGTSDIFEGTGEVSIESVAWTAGSKLRYTLTLSDNGTEIVFTPKVGDWTEESAGPVQP